MGQMISQEQAADMPGLQDNSKPFVATRTGSRFKALRGPAHMGFQREARFHRQGGFHRQGPRAFRWTRISAQSDLRCHARYD